MSSFADRFKDKAQIVGKTGEGAMLVAQTKPPPPPRTNSSAAAAAGGTKTPPLSGNRAHRPLLPSEGSKSVLGGGGGAGGPNYRDHIRGLSSKNNGGGSSSSDIQLQFGVAGVAGRERGSRTMSTPRANALAEQPHGPMLFGQNKYRNKEQISPPKTSEEGSPRSEPNYVPYTVEDWRQKKDVLAVVKGGVGRLPSDTDEQRLYRALRNRMKEFGHETETINKVALLPENLPRPPKPLTPPPSEELLEKTKLRQKAVEFAKRVPKPRVAPKLDGTEIRKGGDNDDDDLFEFSDERRKKEAEIADLEEQHRRDQDAIAAMKKRFAM